MKFLYKKGVHLVKDLPRYSYNYKEAAYCFFKENGFVIFNDAFDLNLFEVMKQEIGALLHLQVQKHLTHHSEILPGNGFDRGLIELGSVRDLLRGRFYDVIQGLPSLYLFGFGSPFVSIAKDLGVNMPILRAIQFRMDFPGDERFLIKPHQEIRSIRSPNLIFFITPLVDICEEKGAIQIAPGSHKLGPLMPSVEDTHDYQFIPEEVYGELYPMQQVPMVVGETLVMNMYTIHGSSPNFSKETRWQSIVRIEDAANMPFLDGDDSLQKFNLKG